MVQSKTHNSEQTIVMESGTANKVYGILPVHVVAFHKVNRMDHQEDVAVFYTLCKEQVKLENHQNLQISQTLCFTFIPAYKHKY